VRRLALLAALVPLGAWSASPDEPQRLLVFEKDVGGNMDIYAIPAAGGGERRLTDDAAKDALPRFLPDGRSVLFSSERSGEWQLYEVGVAGGAARRVLASTHRQWQADPSPDGRWIAFLAKPGAAEALWMRSRAGGAARELANHGERVILGNPNWNKDGSRIVFSSNRGFAGHSAYIVDIATGREERISPLTSGACEPRFSRSGDKVAYVRRQHLTRHRSWIVEHDLKTGDERVLVDWEALNYDPAYSPDGGEIAFASTIAGGDFQIYRLRLSDKKSWRVTQGRGIARHPDYRPQP
jgi:Tol biopolymer transport system component